MKQIFLFTFLCCLIYYGFYPNSPVAPDFNEMIRFIDNLLLGPFRALAELRNGLIPAVEALFEWIQTIFPGFEVGVLEYILDFLEKIIANE